MKIKKYKIGEDGKLILLGFVEDSAITEAGPFTLDISDATGEIISLEGRREPTPGDSVSKEKLREAFKRLRPEWDEQTIEIAIEGKVPP